MVSCCVILLFVAYIAAVTAQDSVYADCPRGTYRENYLSRECKPCLKGFYGNTHGLTTPTCASPCPVGRYGDTVGAKTVDDCTLCPQGFIGSEEGLTTSRCSMPCPKGRYSSSHGATSVKDCIVCPPGYSDWQCYNTQR